MISANGEGTHSDGVADVMEGLRQLASREMDPQAIVLPAVGKVATASEALSPADYPKDLPAFHYLNN